MKRSLSFLILAILQISVSSVYASCESLQQCSAACPTGDTTANQQCNQQCDIHNYCPPPPYPYPEQEDVKK
jgi:epoxyqueuosine reductase QueG